MPRTSQSCPAAKKPSADALDLLADVQLTTVEMLPAVKRWRDHPREHLVKPFQPPSRVNLPYAWRHGRSVIHQCSHKPDDHGAAVSRHARTPPNITKCY